MITDARAVACRSCRSTERPLIDNFCMSCRFDLVAAKPIQKPYPYQTTSIEYLTQNPNTVLTHAPGLGKGHPRGTKILTPAGWALIEDLYIGDKVVGAHGKAVRVTGVYDRGVLPTYRVLFNDGSSILVDGDHLWQYTTKAGRRNGYAPYVNNTAYLEERLRHTTRLDPQIPIVEPVEFEHMNHVIDPYVLGVLLGDGTLTQLTSGRKAVTFCSGYDTVPDEVEKLLTEHEATMSVYDEPLDDHAPTYTVHSSKIVQELCALGLAGKYSHEKFIPQDYLFSDPEQRIAMLQGLMDTDGWMQGVYTTETLGVTGTCQFSSSSEQLANDVQFLVESLGGVARKNVKREPKYPGNDWHLRIGRPAYILTITMPYGINPFRANADTYVPHIMYGPMRQMSSITLEGSAQVRCISVDAPDQLYVTEHCIVTHNTYCSTEAAYLNTPPTWSIVVFTSALLTEQWYDFIRAQYPFDTVSLIGAGSKAARIQALKSVPHARWYIFNYEIVRGNDYFELLKQLPIYTLILDESHHVKNRPQRKIAPDRTLTYAPLQSKRIFEISQLSTVRARYLLTATPIVREADDLFWQLHILDPIKFASYDNFLRDYCYTNWTSYGPADIVLHKAAERLLQATYIHGYSYEDAGMYLPPLISDVLPVPMEPELKTKYNELRDFWRTEFRSGDPDSRFTIDNAMAAMHSLRHMTALSSAKLAALLDKFDNTPGPHIIFCHYKDSAKRVAAAIAAHQRTHQDVSWMFNEDPTTSHRVPHAPKPPALITGDVPPDDRSNVAKTSDVVVATINSLTEGVDLSRAKTVLFFEEDFVPGKMYQALSRIRRTDHKEEGDPAHHVVLCYYIVAAHTIDATIHKKQSSRATSIKDFLTVELAL